MKEFKSWAGGKTDKGREFQSSPVRDEKMKIMVNSCIRNMDRIGMRRSRKSCAERLQEVGGMQLASSESSQHKNSGRRQIEMQHCGGDLKNQDSQLEEES